jgi:hypothetical protein
MAREGPQEPPGAPISGGLEEVIERLKEIDRKLQNILTSMPR